MFKLPLDFATSSEVFAHNEKGQGGFFPIGSNNCWHSGIHLLPSERSSWIQAVYEGDLIALHIPDDVQEGELPEQVTQDEYLLLPEELGKPLIRKSLAYKPFVNETPNDKAGIVKAAVGIMCLTDAGKRSKSIKSSGFALVRHNLSLPYKNGTTIVTFNVFTLYSNLLPDKYYNLGGYERDFRQVQSTDIQLPLQRKWKFKVKETDQISFTIAGGGRAHIAKLSTCLIKTGDFFKAQGTQNTYRCSFHNAPGTNLDVHRFDLEKIENIRLTPTNGQVEFFHADTTQGLSAMLGTVSPGTLMHYDRENNNEGKNYTLHGTEYLKVGILGSALTYTKTPCWLYLPNAPTFKPGIDSWVSATTGTEYRAWKHNHIGRTRTILYQGSEQTALPGQAPFVITELPREGSPTNVFRVIKRRDFNRLSSQETKNRLELEAKATFERIKRENPFPPPNLLSSPMRFEKEEPAFRAAEHMPDDFIVIHNRLHHRMDIDGIIDKDTNIFYCYQSAGKLHEVIDLPPSEFRAFEREPLERAQVIILKGSRMVLRQGDCLELNAEHNPPCPLNEIKGFVPCRFYIVQNEISKWLVKAENAQLESAQGRMAFDASAFRFDHQRPGCMVYDSNGMGSGTDLTGKSIPIPSGNARQVLELDQEFELVNAELFMRAPQPGLWPILYNNLEGRMSSGFIHIIHPERVHAKAVRKDEFRNESYQLTEGNPRFRIRVGERIGRTLKQGTRFDPYDLVCFMKNRDFIQKNADTAPLLTYTAPTGKQLFKAVGLAEQKTYLHLYTFLTICPGGTHQFNGKTAHKLQVKKLYLYFRNRDVAEYKAASKSVVLKAHPPTKFWLADSAYNIDFEKNSENVPQESQQLVLTCKLLQTKLAGKELPCVVRRGAVVRGDAGEYLCEVELDASVVLDFWIYAQELKPEFTVLDENGTVQIKANTVFTTYTENPLIHTVSPIPDSKIVSDIHFESYTHRVQDRTQKAYIKLPRSDNYVAESDITTIDLLDWPTHFPLIDKPDADTDGDVVCDIPDMIAKLDIGEQNPGNTGKSDGKISRKELLDFYAHGESNSAAIKALRTTFIKHPLEFDKSLWTDAIGEKLKNNQLAYDPDTIAALKKDAEIYDYWSKIKMASEFSNDANSFYFAHPIAFFEHLDRLKALESHPFIGASITVPAGGMILETLTETAIQSNPGFAPVCSHDTGSKLRYKDGWVGYCTGLYKQKRTRDIHTGIDLATNRTPAPIISFIHGTVWATTWKGSIERGAPQGYGKVMIIKHATEDRLYLLAHLSDYCKQVDDPVYPGETVALTGSTGNSTGEHLHLEVFECSETNKFIVLAADKNKVFGAGAGFDWEPNYKTPLSKRRNPFRH